MTLLVLGSTGTLGRQIVRKALNEGFNVKCLVRNFRKAAFLKEWGAELIYGDLSIPETIPLSLLGVTALVDCSTLRINDFYNVNIVDLNAKYILIESAIKAKVRRFVFFSIFNASLYKEVKFLRSKVMIENRIKKSGLNFTIFCIPGFFQGLIPQYALPILDRKPVWITSESSIISYVSTQDVSSIAIKSLSISQFNNKYLPIAGNKNWKSSDVIQICELTSGRRANIKQVPLYILNLIQNIIKIFQWSSNISDRLEFTNVLSRGYYANADMKEILYILKLNFDEIEPLELYLKEYFERIMKKVREMNDEVLSNNKDYNNDSDF
uniref:NmrA-like domain-containing protein n=1 Tax=Tolypiocladia glomerulata TaxID=860646 RepID=A0A1Z1MUE8_9FLOR|nr:hypothetical protein [Tolypiocladia glomerulata]ARW69727.1 hypothetical protein [Tolypiocladia glomerulata]